MTARAERIPGQEAAREKYRDKVRDILTDPAPSADRAHLLDAAGDEYAAAMVELHARPNVVVRDGRVRLEGAS